MKDIISFTELTSADRRDALAKHPSEAATMRAAKVNVFELNDGSTDYYYVAPDADTALAELQKYLDKTLGSERTAAEHEEARQTARESVKQLSLASLYILTFMNDGDGTEYPFAIEYLKRPFGCYLLAEIY